VVVPIVVIVHNARERNLRQALHIIDRFEVIRQKSVAIRIEEI